MPLSDGLAVAGLVLAGVTAVGVVATALVASLNRKDTTLYNLPTLTVRQGRLLDGSVWIRFETEAAQGRPEWAVVSIDVRGNWRLSRILCDGGILCDQGDPRMWNPGSIPFDYKDDVPWHRRIVYDLLVARGIVLIHSDAPEYVSLRYNISLRSAPSKRTSLVERYRVH